MILSCFCYLYKNIILFTIIKNSINLLIQLVILNLFDLFILLLFSHEIGDDRWPFVTHLVGCTLCGCYGDHPVERFLESMERAFNFADNQVLRLYGFSHRARSSTKIRRFRSWSAFLFQILAEEKARSCDSSIGRSNKKVLISLDCLDIYRSPLNFHKICIVMGARWMREREREMEEGFTLNSMLNSRRSFLFQLDHFCSNLQAAIEKTLSHRFCSYF